MNQEDQKLIILENIPLEKAMQLNYDKAVLENPKILKRKKTVISPKKVVQGLAYSDEPLTLEEDNFVKKILSKHFLFKNGSKSIIENFISKTHKVTIDKKYLLFKEGETGIFFYIIYQGEIEIIFGNNKSSKVLSSGDTFGELALIQKTSRSASAISLTNSLLFYVDGYLLRSFILEMHKNDEIEKFPFFSKLSLFSKFKYFLNNLIEGLNEDLISKISSQAIKLTLQNQDKILNNNAITDSLFIIKEGKINYTIDSITLELKENDYFGDYNILIAHNKKIYVRIITETAECYQLQKSTLIKVLGDNYSNAIYKSVLLQAFQKHKIFNFFVNSSLFNKIYTCFDIEIMKINEVVLKKDNDEAIVVSVVGDLVDVRYNLSFIQEGELFYKNNERKLKENLKMKKDGILLMSTWSKLLDVFDSKPSKEELIELCERINKINKIDFLHNMPEDMKFELSEKLIKETYKKNDLIVKENQVDSKKLYILEFGTVDVIKNDKIIRKLKEGDYFGQISLLTGELPTATVIASEDNTELYTIKDVDFHENIDEKIRENLINGIKLMDVSNLELEKIYILNFIKNETNIKIILSHCNNNFYIIKAYSKNYICSDENTYDKICNLKSILLNLNSNFISKLITTIKYKSWFLFIKEYVQGKSFSEYLNEREEKDYYSKENFKFFISNLLVIIRDIHKNKICHRDLRPENFIINDKGYLKLINLDKSTNLRKNYTLTIDGTNLYVPPEVIQGSAYSLSCDYWSIGIIAYKILTNEFPFGNNLNDPMDLYKEILNKDVVINTKIRFNKEESLIKGLLAKDPLKRLSLSRIQDDFHLYDTNLNAIVEFKLKSSYIPIYINKMNEILFKTKDLSLSNYFDSITENINNNDINTKKWINF